MVLLQMRADPSCSRVECRRRRAYELEQRAGERERAQRSRAESSCEVLRVLGGEKGERRRGTVRSRAWAAVT